MCSRGNAAPTQNYQFCINKNLRIAQDPLSNVAKYAFMNNQFPPESASTMQLYDRYSQRLYINAAERLRFIAAANSAPKPIGLFALTLVYSGCRISEARYLTGSALQPEARILSVRCLKKRGRHIVREIPIPRPLAEGLADLDAQPDNYLWSQQGAPIPRITAYRWIKALMADAGISGARACPKGLRHGYGVNATLNGVQLHMLQLWMGHASIRTTAIYSTVAGPDQMRLAEQMWA